MGQPQGLLLPMGLNLKNAQKHVVMCSGVSNLKNGQTQI
jgi:hypothetical protein